MTRSVTFEIPESPRAVIQRSGGKTIVVIRLEDAEVLADTLTDAVDKVRYAKRPPRKDYDDS